MRDRHYVEIFAISLAVILVEISYTRIFSFKLYYYFTYMVIGISLLGLGSGGVLVSVVPALKRANVSRVISICSIASATMVLGGYFVIAWTNLNALGIAHSRWELLRLLAITGSLFGPFLMAGVVIAAIFAADPPRINRLYCADLLGAGLGCLLAVPLIYFITPPGLVMLSGAVFALAGVGASTRLLRSVALCVALVLATLVVRPALLPDLRPDPTKTLGVFAPGTAPVVFSRWSSVFRVDVMPDAFSNGTAYMIMHDGQFGAIMYAFTGDRSTMMRFDGDIRAFPFRVLKPHPEVLIIGSAGGHEMLASLYFDARHVTGIELNPVTVSLLTDHFADFTGHLATHDGVTLINAEGRSYLMQSNRRYDLIWFVAPDSYAAMNAATAGAFVLSESYLYTAEMIAESLDHLTPDGILCAQFGELAYDRKPNRTVRYVTTAREALARRGISDPENHILVATSPPGMMTVSTVLVKRSAFVRDEIERFGAAVREVAGSTARYAKGQATDGVVADAVTLEGADYRRWLAAYRYNVTPVTDDSPFFWHFARFRDAIGTSTNPIETLDREDALGEQVQMVLLLFVVVFAGIALFLPFFAARAIWAQLPCKLTAAMYFAALGAGFMFFEVSLIQMVTLFLGYPSYSLSVTLFALLVFAGLGSLASQRYVARRDLSLAVLFSALVVLVAFYQFGLPWVVQRWIGASLATRITIAIVMIAPLGLCLGAFMPIGLATIADVTEHKTEFIAWGWAVNGFFSVISSILSTILAMVIGFKLVLLSALVIYLLGILALRRIPLHAACGSRTTAAP